MRPEDILSITEFQQLVAACRNDRERALLLLMSDVGLRVSEVAALKIDALDAENEYIYIVGKGDKPRTCVITPTTIEALHTYLLGREDGYIFPGRQSGHISARQIQTLLDEIATRAGIQDTRPGNQRMRKRITPHILRHSFSIWSLESGVPIGDLQQQLGHASLATTGIYLKTRPNHRRENYKRSGFDAMLHQNGVSHVIPKS